MRSARRRARSAAGEFEAEVVELFLLLLLLLLLELLSLSSPVLLERLLAVAIGRLVVFTLQLLCWLLTSSGILRQVGTPKVPLLQFCIASSCTRSGVAVRLPAKVYT